MAENEKMEQAAKAASQKAGKTAKEKKSDKNAKPGFFARVGRWLRELRAELKKVQWPTASQTVNNTLIVIACVLIVGVFIWAFDFVATRLIQALISLLH